jgi:hypothetical protein
VGCAEVCHDGHDVEEVAFGRGYCDCGHAGCVHSADAVIFGADILAGSAGADRIAMDKNGRIDGSERFKLDYKFRAFQLQDNDDRQPFLNGIQAQCEDLVRYSKDTFWLPADAEPHNDLEVLAKAIFTHHTQGISEIPAFSGAEWWTQVKYCDHSGCTDGVDFHYDKDECLAEEFAVGVYPQLSTVSYFTSGGAPTIILDNTTAVAISTPITTAHVSHPQRGKHVVFDGRLLHAAPAHSLLRLPGVDMDGGVRVTFLVNVWLGHRPIRVKRLSDHLQVR